MARPLLAQSTSTPASISLFHPDENKQRYRLLQSPTISAKRAKVDRSDVVDETYCYECDVPFTRPYTFRRHVRDVHEDATVWKCDHNGCHKTFKRKDVLDRHKDTQHGSGKVRCTACSSFVRKDGLREHFLTKACRGARLRKFERIQIRQHPGEYLSESKEMYHYDQPDIEAAAQVPLDEYEIEREDTASTHTTMTDSQKVHPSIVIESAGCEDTMHFEAGSEAVVRGSQNEPDATAIHAATPGSACDSTPLPAQCIVANSPRPVVPDDVLSKLFLLDDTAFSELAEEVEEKRSALEETVAMAQGGTRDSKHSDHGRSLRHTDRSRWSLEMHFGSPCTLCRDSLGHDLPSVLKHARSHIKSCNRPSIECSLCKVKFAHVVDLTLHQNKKRAWSLSQELPPVTVVDPDDWVANAFAEAREAFINLLRSWESLQLHWYLAAIKTMLDREGRQSSACRARTMGFIRPLLDVTTLRQATHSGHYQKHDDSISALVQKFTRTSLASRADPITSRLDPKSLEADEAINQNLSGAWFKMLSEAASAGSEPFQNALTQFEAIHKGDAVYPLVLEKTLLLACREGYVEIARTLLDIGIDVNTSCEDGYSTLAHAIMSSESPKMIELLILRGGRLRQPHGVRSGVLHLAYQNGFVHFMREILRRGADVNALDSRGETVLAYTVRNGDAETTKMLLYAGASPDPLFPGASFHPLGYAASCGLREHVRLLLYHDAKIDRCDSLGTTALMKASSDGATDIVELLLHCGADPTIRDCSGKLAVQFANGPHRSDIRKLFQAASRRQHSL